MSSTGDVLAAFVASLAAQVAPEPVVLDDGSLDHTQLTGTVVRPLTLDRVGRSRRDGAILDLELTVEVTTLGSEAVGMLERHLVTLEQSQSAAHVVPSSSLGVAARSGGPSMSIVAVLPVGVSLSEPQPPLVTKLPVVDVRFVAPLDGVLFDGQQQPIVGAVVRTGTTGVTSVTDKAGRFRLLTTTEAHGRIPIDVSVRGHHHVAEVEQPAAPGATAVVTLDLPDGAGTPTTEQPSQV